MARRRRLRSWNDQMYQVRAFNALIYNTDPNLGNVLTDPVYPFCTADYHLVGTLHHTDSSTSEKPSDAINWPEAKADSTSTPSSRKRFFMVESAGVSAIMTH